VGCSCYFLSSVVVLTPNGQLLGFVTFAFSERNVSKNASRNGRLTVVWLVFILCDRVMSAMDVTNLHAHRKTIAPILGISSNSEAFHQICYWTWV
jgi:hypothetical protein